MSQLCLIALQKEIQHAATNKPIHSWHFNPPFPTQLSTQDNRSGQARRCRLAELVNQPCSLSPGIPSLPPSLSNQPWHKAYCTAQQTNTHTRKTMALWKVNQWKYYGWSLYTAMWLSMCELYQHVHALRFDLYTVYIICHHPLFTKGLCSLFPLTASSKGEDRLSHCRMEKNCTFSFFIRGGENDFAFMAQVWNIPPYAR